MRTFRPALSAVVLSSLCAVGSAAEPDAALEYAVAQLRDAAGEWEVTTEFMAPDGSVSRSAPGTYTFDWVVPDRVLIGTSNIPALDMAAGLLFYVDSVDNEIEMVSVAGDGRLWVMSGPLDSETRMSQPYETADGSRAQLRFTRYNVAPDRFESKMEYTTDGGKTWTQGNRQVFVRAGTAGSRPNAAKGNSGGTAAEKPGTSRTGTQGAPPRPDETDAGSRNAEPPVPAADPDD